MKNVMRSFLMLVCFVCLSNLLYAQTNLFEQRNLSQVNIDNYNDDDIVNFRKKTTDLNISDDKTFEILRNRGMDETEIDKLKLRLEKIDKIGKNNNSKTTINQNSTRESMIMTLISLQLKISKKMNLFLDQNSF